MYGKKSLVFVKFKGTQKINSNARATIKLKNRYHNTDLTSEPQDCPQRYIIPQDIVWLGGLINNHFGEKYIQKLLGSI